MGEILDKYPVLLLRLGRLVNHVRNLLKAGGQFVSFGCRISEPILNGRTSTLIIFLTNICYYLSNTGSDWLMSPVVKSTLFESCG